MEAFNLVVDPVAERLAPPKWLWLGWDSDSEQPRRNVKVPNLQVINAILYVAEPCYKWRGLPARIGNRHSAYTRMNRWSKNGVLDREFEHRQREQIVRIKIEAVSPMTAKLSTASLRMSSGGRLG